MVFTFTDINSPSHDLLNDDYPSSLSLKTKKNAGPLQITIDTTRNPSNGTLSTKLSSKFQMASLNIDKLSLTQDANGVLESTIVPFKNTTLGFNGDSKYANLTLEYKKGNFLTSNILDIQEFQSFKNNTKLSFKSGFSVATNLNVDLGNNKVSSVNLGANYEKGSWFASLYTVNGICKSNDNKSANLGLLYYVNPKVSLASNLNHCYSDCKSDCLTVGGLYKSNVGDIKMKANFCGNMNVSVKREIVQGVNVTASLGGKVNDVGSWKGGLGVTI